MQRFCALTVSREGGKEKKKEKGKEKKEKGEERGGRRREREKRKKEEGKKKKRGCCPDISVGFYGTVAWKFRPFIISRHAPASQQYRPLTISGSHTTPSTATLRPRSNYREKRRRGPLSCFPTSVALSSADHELSGKGKPPPPPVGSLTPYNPSFSSLLTILDKYFLYEIISFCFGKQRTLLFPAYRPTLRKTDTRTWRVGVLGGWRPGRFKRCKLTCNCRN